MIRTITATHYVMPLREGGSLPAIVEGSDDGTWVLKFRGAGQGARALIAELIAGELARALGLRVPEIVFVNLDPRMAKTEPDPEIQDLLRRSEGLNLALDYLPGSITFDPLVEKVDARLASIIVWFDALITNVDRTARNTNLLMWHRELYLIDHGASLYFHHNWDGYKERIRNPFAQIREHVLLRAASELEAVDAELHGTITAEVLEPILASIPDGWMESDDRDAYREYLLGRLEGPRLWVEEGIRARALLV